MDAPVRLEPEFYERVWGATTLAPWFPNPDGKIGEVWFTSDPLLFKYLFTTERLSVQLHPNDEQARVAGLPSGKTEMWHVLRAAPGAVIGLGFKEPIGKTRVRDAALSGEIEHLIDWKPVTAGETYFVPANTVHAIGAGLVICEIQQNADTTYRLYDYGRPRELHLEEAVKIVSGEPHSGPIPPRRLPDGGVRLGACDYFVMDLIEFNTPAAYKPAGPEFEMLAIVAGAGSIAGRPFRAGDVWRVPAGAGNIVIEPSTLIRIIRTYPPTK